MLIKTRHDSKWRNSGLTLIEAIFALAIIGLIVLAVYGAITSGVTSLRMARENLRATQILVEKTESLRLYNWDQLNTNFIPTSFIVPYDATSGSTNSGVLFYGAIDLVNNPDIGTSYSNNIRLVTVRLNWTTGRIQRSREISTYVCRTGIQSYVY
jgi:prepilin-type N-terminal cleavage/methylation domain-containing protein